MNLSQIPTDQLLEMLHQKRLIGSVINQESGGNPNAVSPKGARGLMQIMPATARDPGFGVTPLQNDSPEENIRFGTDYLNAMKNRYGNDQDALAAYNGGPGRVDNHLQTGAPLPAETQNYVSSITNKMGGTYADVQPKPDLSQYSNEQLLGMLKQKRAQQVPQQTEAEIPQPPGFAQRVSEDVDQRGQNISNINSLRPQQPLGSTALQMAGEGFGTANDVIGEGFKSFGNYFPETTNAIKQGFGAAANAVVNNPMSKVIGENVVPPIAEKVGQAYQYLSNNDPESFRNLQAVGNIAPWLVGVGEKSGANLAVDAAGAGGKLIGSGAEAAGTAVKGVTKNLSENFPSKVDAISPGLKDKARAAYKLGEEKGGVLNEDFVDTLLNDAQKHLPQSAKEEEAFGKGEAGKLISSLDSYRGQPLTLAEAERLDQRLGEKIDTLVDPKTGIVDNEGRKLLDVQTNLRSMIENPEEGHLVGGREGFDASAQGRKLWAKAARANDIERIIQRSELTDNPATSIKAGMRTLLMSPARMRGFSPKEAMLIKQAAKNGIVGDGLRTVLGNRLISTGLGAAFGGPVGAAAGLGTSAVSRNLAERMQLGKAGKVLKAIEQRPSENLSARFKKR